MLSFRTNGYCGQGVRYSPFFDSRLAVASSANFGLVGNGKLYILDIGADGIVRSANEFETQDGLFDLAWSELHENHIITAAGDAQIRMFDTTTRQPFPLQVFAGPQGHKKEVHSVEWNLVDKSKFCSGSWDCTVKVWDASIAAAPVQTIQTDSYVYVSKFSPRDPTMLGTANADSSFSLFDVRSNKRVLHTLGTGECLAFDWNKYRPTVFATAGVDKIIKVWDSRNAHAPVNELIGHDLAVKSLSWSPHDALTLLSTSYDMTVRVWVDDQQQSRYIKSLHAGRGFKSAFTRHTEFVQDADWSMWGEPGWVASVGWDQMMYIWKYEQV